MTKTKQRPLRQGLKNKIIRAYRTVGHPIAFSAPGRVAKHFEISRAQAKSVLQEIDSYTTHKEYKRPRQFNPYYIYEPTFFQSDLMEVRPFAKYNNGIHYLCLIICVFSRKIWVYPMKNKSAASMRAVLELWLDNLPLHVRVKTYMTDRGREYVNASVSSLLANRRIEHRLASGTSKCAYAERAQKSFQILLYKYLSDNETMRYIDILDALTQTYNTREHRGLKGMSPNEAFRKENKTRVRGIHMERYSKVKRRRPKLKVGDIVRVKSFSSSKVATSKRSYVQQFKAEYFIITKVNTDLAIPMYEIKSLDNDENIIGQFYESELSKVKPDAFKVERVIRWKGKKPNRRAFVKWLHFGPQHNSWIAERDIVEEYRHR